MSGDLWRKLAIPLAAAVAVLAVLGTLWITIGRHDGSDDHGAAASPGSPGGGSQPGNPGTGTPPDQQGDRPPSHTSPGGKPGGTPGGGAPTDPDLIQISGFRTEGSNRLGLDYAIGVPECYGYAGQPDVVETDSSVVVTLRRIPPKASPDQACIDLAILKTTWVTLDRPLDGRVVRDGSTGRPVERSDARYLDMTN
jgi:hypothetical protein